MLFTKSICLGSTPEREQAYLDAAKKRTDGNLSKLICSIVDKALGLNLPPPIKRGRKAKTLALLVCVLAMGLTACKKEPGERRTDIIRMNRNGEVAIYSGAVNAGVPYPNSTTLYQRIAINADIVNHSNTDKIDISLCKADVCAPPPGVAWTAGVYYVDLINAQSYGYTTYTIATTLYHDMAERQH